MVIKNKKARFDYELLESFEAGIVLLGGEVRAIRSGKVSLNGAFGKVIGNEVYLVNAKVPIPGKKDYQEDRNRKLLLHRSEIVKIISETKAKRLTLVPEKIYTSGRLIKVALSLGKSKRKYRENSKKERKIKRDTEREIKLG